MRIVRKEMVEALLKNLTTIRFAADTASQFAETQDKLVEITTLNQGLMKELNASSIAPAWADIMFREYSTSQDLDDDGRIFGLDFLIDAPTDIYPPCLRFIVNKQRKNVLLVTPEQYISQMTFHTGSNITAVARIFGLPLDGSNSNPPLNSKEHADNVKPLLPMALKKKGKSNA